ncbi:MAG: crossover junction endodeoxyribonuclease RuvC [Saprospiraceae bacterium]|jgi:crossover junction endodeoxyribonuclease RuvC|nr:crossover junction endodeoxyribonuclease RuvC [Saprospiraceae bacterium]MBP9193706.1 crossover junction endodeoxyribonuclease RuvC [Saprospiraceae bacterium]
MQSNLDSYKILGVDPGTNILGYAILEITGKQVKIITFGVIKLFKEEDQAQKLKEIFLQVQEIIESYLPRYLAIEAPFYGKNVQSMLKLGRAQGVAIAAGITMGLEVSEYSPKRIKQAVTGNGNASKEQVSAMLEHILKVKIQAQYNDATDALATAYCHFNQIGGGLGPKEKVSGWKAFMTANPDRVKKTGPK